MIIPNDIKEANEKLLEKKLNHIMCNSKTIEGMEREDFKIRYAWALLFSKETNSYIEECEKQ